MTFLFFEIQKKQLKSNSELKMFETNCGRPSIFHSLSTDNQLSDLRTSIPILKKRNTEKDLHLLTLTLVFN